MNRFDALSQETYHVFHFRRSENRPLLFGESGVVTNTLFLSKNFEGFWKHTRALPVNGKALFYRAGATCSRPQTTAMLASAEAHIPSNIKKDFS